MSVPDVYIEPLALDDIAIQGWFSLTDRRTHRLLIRQVPQLKYQSILIRIHTITVTHSR